MTKTKKAKNGKISDAKKAEDLSQDAIPKDGTAETVTGHDTTLFNTEEVILDIDNQASIANPSMYLTQDSLATAVDMNTENKRCRNDSDSDDKESFVSAPDREPTETAAANGRSSKRQATLPVFTKPKIQPSIIPKITKSPDKEHTRSVWTLQMRCGTNICGILMLDGKPAYAWPLLEKIRESPDFAVQNWKIDHASVRRNPRDPNEVMEYHYTVKKGNKGEASSPSTRKSLQNIFIRFPEDDFERSAEFRNKWGSMVASIYNSPVTQSKLFGQNTLAFYGGDLTPEHDRPYLSDYLTIKHTIDALEIAFSNRSRQEIVNDDSILVYYFPKNMIKIVRESEASRQKSVTHAYMTFEEGPTFNNF